MGGVAGAGGGTDLRAWEDTTSSREGVQADRRGLRGLTGNEDGPTISRGSGRVRGHWLGLLQLK